MASAYVLHKQNPFDTNLERCKAAIAQVKAFIVLSFHSDTMTTKVFLNLPVQDLNKAIEFFTKLEFSFDPSLPTKMPHA